MTRLASGLLALAALARTADATLWSTTVVLSPFDAITPIGTPSAYATAVGSGSGALGYVSVTVDDVANTITFSNSKFWNIVPTMAHIHSGLFGGLPGIVLIPLSTGLNGVYPIPAANVTAITTGATYVNVHSASFPSGEIRGQIALNNPGTLGVGIAALTTGQEGSAPNVPSSAYGMGQILINDVAGTVTVQNLFVVGIQNVTNLHIHGPSRSGANAAVICLIASSQVAQVAFPYTGFTCPGTFNSTQLAAFRDGLTYFNIHTTQNPGGEVRGQIYFPAFLSPASAVAAALSPAAGVVSKGSGAAMVMSYQFQNLSATNGYSAIGFSSATNLTAAQTAQHIHCNANATCAATGYPIPFPLLFGTVAHYPLYQSAPGSLLADMLAGNTYFNVHSTFAPGGEISGAFSALPVPVAASPPPSASPPASTMTPASPVSSARALAALPAVLLVAIAIAIGL